MSDVATHEAPVEAAAPAEHSGHGHGHGPEARKKHIRLYWVIWVWLLILTILEVGVVFVPIAKGLLISALVLLAITKATMVALWYMHLIDETVWLRWSIAIPMALPAFYALALIADAMWRMLPAAAAG